MVLTTAVMALMSSPLPAVSISLYTDTLMNLSFVRATKFGGRRIQRTFVLIPVVHSVRSSQWQRHANPLSFAVVDG